MEVFMFDCTYCLRLCTPVVSYWVHRRRSLPKLNYGINNMDALQKRCLNQDLQSLQNDKKVSSDVKETKKDNDEIGTKVKLKRQVCMGCLKSMKIWDLFHEVKSSLITYQSVCTIILSQQFSHSAPLVKYKRSISNSVYMQTTVFDEISRRSMRFHNYYRQYIYINYLHPFTTAVD